MSDTEHAEVDAYDMPSAAELQKAAEVCTRLWLATSRRTPWWKRWMYDTSALQTTGELLFAASVIMADMEKEN